jgi:hypothetical protein
VNLTYTRDLGQATPTWGAPGYNINTDPHIVFDNDVWGIFVPGFPQSMYVNTGSINSPAAQWNLNPPLGSVAPTGVYTYANDWTFGSDLTLTVPGDIQGPATQSIPGGDYDSHTVSIAPASNASDKKFKFRIDQNSGPFTRASLDMPFAEVDKQVGISFPHTNNTCGYIFNQGANTYDDGMNNAFNLLFNSGDIKLTAEGTDGLKTWRFGNDGKLTLPTGGTVSYTPATSTDWSGTPPATIQAAIDRLAAAFKTLNNGTGA